MLVCLYHMCVKSLQSCQILRPYGLKPTRLFCPWDSPGENTGVGCHFLLQGTSRPRDPICVSCVSCIGRQVLYHWCTWEAPCVYMDVYVKNEHRNMFTAVQQDWKLSPKGQIAYVLGFRGQSVSVATQRYLCSEPVIDNT